MSNPQSPTTQKASTDWIKIGSFVIPLLAFLLGGGFFYTEIWQSKVLTYTILPSYDLEQQAFSGLVVENRGRVPLSEVEIVVSNLSEPIVDLNLSGPHETAELISGGEGEEEFVIAMPRLSTSSSIAIYMVTTTPADLEPNQNILVTSSEVAGKPSTEQQGVTVAYSLLIVVMTAVALLQITEMVSDREERRAYRWILESELATIRKEAQDESKVQGD